MILPQITATYRITTPMFCAGADPTAGAELRPASFKGVLRFYFRALAWAEHGDWRKVKRAEDELFGSVEGGQANVLLSLSALGPEKPVRAATPLSLGLGYLAGQGLAKPQRDGAVTKRHALADGMCFQARFLLRSASQQQEWHLRSALIALGLLGGLGSRARRGFGSLTLERLTRQNGQNEEELWKAPRNLSQLEAEIRKLLPGKAPHRASGLPDVPPYTAISKQSRFVLLPANAGETAREILARLGMALLHFRSYGRKQGSHRLVGTEPALKQFQLDHDQMLRVAQGHLRQGYRPQAPLRAAFGLPHNYFFRSVGPDGTKVDVNAAGWNRRASPLLLHVHHPLGCSPVAVVSFLPAVFLPDRSPALSIRQGRTSVSVPLPASPQLWAPIHDFMNELMNGAKVCEKFPGAVEVMP